MEVADARLLRPGGEEVEALWQDFQKTMKAERQDRSTGQAQKGIFLGRLSKLLRSVQHALDPMHEAEIGRGAILETRREETKNTG